MKHREKIEFLKRQFGAQLLPLENARNPMKSGVYTA